MLQAMRKGTKSPIMRGFLLLLVAGFGLWGIGDVVPRIISDDSAIKAGDVEVPPETVARLFERTRLTTLPGVGADEAIERGLLDVVLGAQLQQTLFAAEARRMGMRVTPEMERAAIEAEPAFRNADGRFDPLLFSNALARGGFDEAGYLAFLRNSLPRDHIRQAIAGSSPGANPAYPGNLTRALARRQTEKRVVRHTRIFFDPESVPVPSDSEIEEWFAEIGGGGQGDRNAAYNHIIESPARRDVSVVTLTPENLAATISVDEDAIRAAYDDRIALFARAETRALRQMVFRDGDDGDAASRAATAKTRLDAGEDFIAVAADMLGFADPDTDTDIGTLTRDALTGILGEEIAGAVFTPVAAEVVGPYTSPLGVHLIAVEKINPGSIIPFAQLRDELAAELRRETATDLLYERIADLEDAIDSGKTLAEAAAEVGGDFTRIEGLTLDGTIAGGGQATGIAANDAFRSDIWDAPIGEVGTAREIAGDGEGFYIARVESATEARLNTLEEVRDEVILAMRNNRAREKFDESFFPLAKEESIAEAARLGYPFSDEITISRDGRELPLPDETFLDSRKESLANMAFGANGGGVSGRVHEDGKFVHFMDVIMPVRTILPDDAAMDAAAAQLQLVLDQSLRAGMESALLRGYEKMFSPEISPEAVQRLLVGSGN